jgi:hypothetical protein
MNGLHGLTKGKWEGHYRIAIYFIYDTFSSSVEDQTYSQ